MSRPKRKLIYYVHHLDHLVVRKTKYGGTTSSNFTRCWTMRKAVSVALRFGKGTIIERRALTGKRRGATLKQWEHIG